VFFLAIEFRASISHLRLNSKRDVAALLLVLVLTACTAKQKQGQPQPQPPATVSDPTPPDPPNSVEVPADIKHMPTFLLMAIGGIASEGEKEGI
jgi:multidrug efflux pump subunit AcrA (membrane-fusion protein)